MGKETTAKHTEKPADFYVVGVGTSAGGIDALSKLLGGFNGHTHNMAVVVVQHLSPNYKSELTSILSRNCKWPVLTAEDGMTIEPHNIYVTPQNKKIIFDEENVLRLSPLSPQYSYAPSIDEFLVSLAQVAKQHAIGIILSGTGNDGARGIQAIKENGGFSIAQSPQTAQYIDMPNAAIQTQMVDLVSHPAKIFEEITYYIKNHRVVRETSINQKSINVIFELLSKRTGIDFSQYKPNTILRRLDKRIEALRLSGIDEYYQWIKKTPGELDTLFDTVLIGVTEFFRDTEAFEMLRKTLEEDLGKKRFSDTIRVWCVSCATGEEPYSVAMLIHEILGHAVLNYQVQVFATDIDERALNFARKGLFSKKSVERVAPELLEKYFDESEQGFEVKKAVKQHILFSRHDITNDPPFVKLDLVVCRNLLIYFNNQLQKEALRIFNYALKPSGLLFLGKSESVSVADDLFEKIDGPKLFRKIQPPSPLNLRFSRYKTRMDATDHPKPSFQNMSLVDIAKETLYSANEHPFVVVNEQGDIKEVQGSLRLYMDVGRGGKINNVYKMVNQEFVMEIRSLIAQAKKKHTHIASPVIKFALFDREHFVRLKIGPMIYPSPGLQHFILMFEDISPDENFIRFVNDLSAKDFENYRIRELEQEVSSLQDHLKTFTEELENTNEEMQAINEELQSANEELKSANEELETSNEELQSANEELNTSNQELRFANSLLIEKEAELKTAKQTSERNALLYKTIADNIPNGTIGVLNDRFEIKFLAGKGLQKWEVNVEDMIGKVLPDLNPSEEQQKIIRDAFRKTLQGEPCSVEFSYMDNTFTLNTVPLNTGLNDEFRILCLTQNITEKKNADLLLKTSEEKFRMLADNIPTLCWMANADGYIYWYNSQFYEYTGTTLPEMEGWGWQSLHDPEVLPEVLEKWKHSLATGVFFEMTFPVKGRDGKFRPFLTRVLPMTDTDGKVTHWFGTNTDISEQQMAAEKLEQLVNERTAELVKLNETLEQKNAELIEAREFLQLVIDTSVEYIP